MKGYHRYMKQYIKAIFPADFKNNPAFWRAFMLGIVMLVLAVAQLFQFEDFPKVIADMQVPGGAGAAWALAALLPLLEIASLPYLLSMQVSSRMRATAKWAALLTAMLWLALTLWATINMASSVQSGLFGATIVTASGWWSVLFAVLLLWSIWLTTRELPKRRTA